MSIDILRRARDGLKAAIASGEQAIIRHRDVLRTIEAALASFEAEVEAAATRVPTLEELKGMIDRVVSNAKGQ